jgi:hypothetical protein
VDANTNTKWQLRGESLVSCNCDWGCPCQFNALPTHDNCEALSAWQIHQGHFGDVKLDGIRFVQLYWWPGPVHEGNGIRQTVVDASATPEQGEAIEALCGGKHGGGYLEIFAAVCPNALEPIFAPITFEADREARTGAVRIPDIGEIQAEPIKNPVTGEPHRVRINLPEGFEYKVTEIANAARLRVSSGDKLNFEHQNSHAHMNEFDWSN